MTDSITRKEEPVVPPGVVAFKDRGSFRWFFDKSEMKYNKWVKSHLEMGSQIMAILVDGIQWKVQERVSNGTITALIWQNNEWVCELDNNHDPKYVVSSLTKLHPTPEQGMESTTADQNRIMNITAKRLMKSEQGTGKVHPNSKEVFERESGHVSLSEYKALFQENADLGEEICLLNEEVASLKFALVSPIKPTPDKGVWTDEDVYNFGSIVYDELGGDINSSANWPGLETLFKKFKEQYKKQKQ